MIVRVFENWVNCFRGFSDFFSESFSRWSSWFAWYWPYWAMFLELSMLSMQSSLLNVNQEGIIMTLLLDLCWIYHFRLCACCFVLLVSYTYVARTLQKCCSPRVVSSKNALFLKDLTRTLAFLKGLFDSNYGCIVPYVARSESTLAV